MGHRPVLPYCIAEGYKTATLRQALAFHPGGTGERPAGRGTGMSAQCHEPLLAPQTEADQRGAGDAPPRAGRDPPQRASDAPPDSESVTARRLRARGLVGGEAPPRIASVIKDECGPRFGTTWIRAYRLALGITLADVVEQVRAWYEAEDRDCPRFSETLLSAYESGQKRPG